MPNGEDLARVFARSEQRAFSGRPFQFTDAGIWLPTPLEVIDSALAALTSKGFWKRLGRTPTAMDAGMGDGRLVASLCRLGKDFRACGIEIHPSLFSLALENLRALPMPNWSVCRGSFLDIAAYEALGVPFGQIDVVFNYPDGNEDALARFCAKHGREGALLVLMTPDRSIRLEGLTLESELSIERGFRMYLYRLDARQG